MITEKRKWIRYTYFNRNPVFLLGTAHLFSPVKKNIPGMVRIPFPTMVVELKDQNFTTTWSKSTRYKISRAEKESLVIRRGLDLLPAILDLFQKTALKKQLRGFHPDDFQSKPWIECSAVFSEQNMLAGHIWVIDKTERRALLFVNASDHLDELNDASFIGRAHYYLLWQDGLFYQNTGTDVLDLQGYHPEAKDPAMAGVNRWKEGTHGRQEILYQYYPRHIYWLRKFRNMAGR